MDSWLHGNWLGARIKRAVGERRPRSFCFQWTPNSESCSDLVCFTFSWNVVCWQKKRENKSQIEINIKGYLLERNDHVLQPELLHGLYCRRKLTQGNLYGFTFSEFWGSQGRYLHIHFFSLCASLHDFLLGYKTKAACNERNERKMRPSIHLANSNSGDISTFATSALIFASIGLHGSGRCFLRSAIFLSAVVHFLESWVHFVWDKLQTKCSSTQTVNNKIQCHICTNVASASVLVYWLCYSDRCPVHVQLLIHRNVPLDHSR